MKEKKIRGELKTRIKQEKSFSEREQKREKFLKERKEKQEAAKEAFREKLKKNWRGKQ